MHLNILKVRPVLLQIVNALFILQDILAQLYDLIEQTLLSALSATTANRLFCSRRVTRRVQFLFRKSFSKFPFLRGDLILVSSILWINDWRDISLNSADHAGTELFELLKDHLLGLMSILSHLNTLPVYLLSLSEVSFILFKVQCIRHIEVGFHQSNPASLHVLIHQLCISHHPRIFHPYDQVVTQLSYALILNEARISRDCFKFFKK